MNTEGTVDIDVNTEMLSKKVDPDGRVQILDA